MVVEGCPRTTPQLRTGAPTGASTARFKGSTLWRLSRKKWAISGPRSLRSICGETAASLLALAGRETVFSRYRVAGHLHVPQGALAFDPGVQAGRYVDGEPLHGFGRPVVGPFVIGAIQSGFRRKSTTAI